MDNVKIGEGVVIQGSIICTNSKLSQKSEFKDCLVGYDQDVVSTGNISFLFLKKFESLFQIKLQKNCSWKRINKIF